MKYQPKLAFFTLFLSALAASACSNAQVAPSAGSVILAERNLGGPRLGVTYIAGNSVLTEKLHERNIGRILSQFGWHFEYQVIPRGGGPSFCVQFVPLAAGVEYGALIPNFTLAMGVRFPSGIEFGLGPNLLIGAGDAMTSLVIALGKSFDYGGVSIPLNLVWSTSREGNRLSILFGYALD